MKPVLEFSEFNLPAPLLEALKRMEFKTATPIQAACLPPALSGKDILGIAPTGTGKTGAFGIPSLAALYPQPGKQVLVLAPTRELAAQIFKFMRQLGEKLNLNGTLIVGGESFWRQCREIKKGVDFMVATPGRLNDHLNNGMPLGKVSTLILDEVDRMLDMGFAPQVEQIVMHLPRTRQTYLFSATMPREIQQLASRLLKDPQRITVPGTLEQAPKIKEEHIETTSIEKPRLLMDQVAARTGKILVFVNTQGHSEQVVRHLENAGHPAVVLHGGRTHSERKKALESFRTGVTRILVATDIAARGIDVPDIEHVINYDRPHSEEDYTHRIGRTGRFGKTGSAVNFLDERSPRRKSHRGRPQNHRGGPQRKPRHGGGRDFNRRTDERRFGQKNSRPAKATDALVHQPKQFEAKKQEGREENHSKFSSHKPNRKNPRGDEFRSEQPKRAGHFGAPKHQKNAFFKKKDQLPKFIERAEGDRPKNFNPRGKSRTRPPFKSAEVAKHWSPRPANKPFVRGSGGTLRRGKPNPSTPA